jgi:hypothetical protein
LITAKSTSGKVTASDTVSVKVPDLVNFRDLIFIPNGERPYTFDQSTQTAKENHPDNDWCTTEMGNSLFAGIVDFNFWSASKKGVGVPLIVSLNDMSLQCGGLFDAGNANWDPLHNAHRIGLSVDINPNGLLTYQIKELTELMKPHGGTRNKERPQIHYGFFGRGN